MVYLQTTVVVDEAQLPKPVHEKTQPGQSGNPAGRPLGSKNKIAEDFIEAIAADFEQHGKDVI